MPAYIWQYWFQADGGTIEISIYDPTRYLDPDSGKPQGGPRFGYSAEVHVRPGGMNPLTGKLDPSALTVQVGQGGVGTLPPDQARLRMDVMAQAVDLAEAIARTKDVPFQDLPDLLKFPMLNAETDHRFKPPKAKKEAR